MLVAKPIFISGLRLLADDAFGGGAVSGKSEDGVVGGAAIGVTAGGVFAGASDGGAAGAFEGRGTGGEAAGGLTGGEAAGGVTGGEAAGGAGSGAATAADTVLIATFMPPLQWPGVPQMKYLFPGAVSLTIEFPSVKVFTGLLNEHAS